ncbi:hypothetical protein BH24DEI1_BH24DEI1_05960 [soil metagenome]|jgi:hypothetical protein|nr:DUF3108 domain-containing protein [Deinococcota bacterium]
MSVEVCSYRLSLRGKSVGSQVLRTQTSRHQVRLEARLTLQGSLGQATVTQTSSLHTPSLLSQLFSETQQDNQEKRHYQVAFDERSGLVRASCGKDSAEVPYSRPYRDPLGLLHLIRALPENETSLRVPMLGKDVVVERLPDAELRTALGNRAARVYALYPGHAYVFVDCEAPHTILKLSQRLEAGLLDALIVRVSQEDEMPSGEGRPSLERGRGSKRRNRRSGRKRMSKRRQAD